MLIINICTANTTSLRSKVQIQAAKVSDIMPKLSIGFEAYTLGDLGLDQGLGLPNIATLASMGSWWTKFKLKYDNPPATHFFLGVRVGG